MTMLQNTRKPTGFKGRLMLGGMNVGHYALAAWGLEQIRIAPHESVLDIGCGGGANIERMLSMCPNGRVDGIDYSEESVAYSCRKNKKALGRRCDIRQGDAGKLPYADETYTLVTAFETVYFWPDLNRAFSEALRVLKRGGRMMIVCEMDDPAAGQKWMRLIPGMTVRRGADIQAVLESVGFEKTELYRNDKGNICLIAHKPQHAAY